MSDAAEKTITLPAEEAGRIEALVESGAYATAAEVIREALLALEERNTTLEEWLREQVAPAYDAYHADPSRGIPADEVFDEVLARHTGRTQKSA
jgi:antitoxin ParD1/3/4